MLDPLPLRLHAVAVTLLVLGSFVGSSCAAPAEDKEVAARYAVPAASGVSGSAAWPDSPARVKAAIGPRDPMEMLRERLARKLGAVVATAPDNPNVVQVVARPNAAASGSPATDPHRPATLLAVGNRKSTVRDVASNADLPRPALVGLHEVGHRAGVLDVPRWTYEGSSGPQAWAALAPEFSKCSNGSRQSPIDIRDGIKVELDAVRFDYQPGAFRVIDNGHTVQVNVAPGSSIEVLGRRYELVQFHFHRPSEERIYGRQFDMAVHMVHKDLDGRLAVVAVLLERGGAQPLIQSVWNNLPLEKGEELAARVNLDPNDLLPRGRGYYTYMGSLTTPPCSEGVLWMVMKEPVPISDDQIGIFARLYPMNARPVQSAAGRLIKESN